MVLGAKVKVAPEFVMELEIVRPLNEVADDVATVIAPVCAVPPPFCVTESTPVFVTFPLAYERPDENVVVAVHEGMPLSQASTCPPVP
jgi:hypothetical protein